jgi:hypothetical protein
LLFESIVIDPTKPPIDTIIFTLFVFYFFKIRKRRK